jgi:4-hydroxy-2-oxoheptanedioate aldolase
MSDAVTVNSKQDENRHSATEPLLRNSLKEKLARGERALSMIVRLVQSPEIALLAKSSGFDSLYVDLEHNCFSLETTSRICTAAIAVGIAPLVRVPSASPDTISRILDGGALGVIVPHVTTAEDVRSVVEFAKFAPVGKRSLGGPLPHLQFRKLPVERMRQVMNDATMVVAMLETAAALKNLEEILAVPGLDMLLVGTNDLCSELGIPGQFDHPKVDEAYTVAIAACRRHGKYLGIGGLASRPDLIAKYVALGAHYVSTGSDFQFLQDAATARVNALS